MSMGMMNTGIYGAKIQSWRKANPRDLLKTIVDQNPSADENHLLDLFASTVRDIDNDDHLMSVIAYWFAGNYRALIRPAHRNTRTNAQTARAARNIEAAVSSHIERRARAILLDTILPNGKQLRDATGKDCAKLGPKMGAWLTRIAGKVKPNQIVGDVLSEKQVRALYGR